MHRGSHSAYAAIARANEDLAQGELPLEDIRDYIDVGAREARVAFRLAGQSYCWDAKVEDDWVDASILSRFSDLLCRVGLSRRFTYIDLAGQRLLDWLRDSTRARTSSQKRPNSRWNC